MNSWTVAANSCEQTSTLRREFLCTYTNEWTESHVTSFILTMLHLWIHSPPKCFDKNDQKCVTTKKSCIDVYINYCEEKYDKLQDIDPKESNINVNILYRRIGRLRPFLLRFHLTSLWLSPCRIYWSWYWPCDCAIFCKKRRHFCIDLMIWWILSNCLLLRIPRYLLR